MRIHHIGYLVDDIESAARKFEELGFSRIGEPVEDCLRQIYVLFIKNADHLVELIQPVGKTSPIYGLRKKYRNSPYHICYETNNLRKQIADMSNNAVGGYTLLHAPQPAPAIPGCPDVAFLLGGNIGMIELVEIKEL